MKTATGSITITTYLCCGIPVYYALRLVVPTKGNLVAIAAVAMNGGSQWKMFSVSGRDKRGGGG